MFSKKLNFLFMMMLTIGLAFTMTSCDDDSDDIIGGIDDTDSITNNLGDDDRFEMLSDALERVNLDDVLEQDGPFTIFAPTDAAFDALGVDLNTLSDEQLTEILLYHVLGAEVMSTDLSEGQTYATTASENGPENEQLSILIERSGNAVTLNGNVNVTDADLESKNGVIHAVDAVLMPQDIVDAALANDQFTELTGALGAASGDLVNVLKGTGPFTVFAPTNAAFEAISETTATLTADQLRDVLLYHVVAGNVRAEDLSDDMEVTTQNGDTFMINIDGSNVSITDSNDNSINVLLTNVQTTNGVIHVIDGVLLPTS